jgi:tRNA (cmo5U34)-methyltransferase
MVECNHRKHGDAKGMDQEKRTAEIRSGFAEGSSDYDARTVKIVPRYEEMLEALVSCIVTNESKKIRAIDVGCGTGALSEKLLERYPNAELTCLDMTESMLNIAKERMKDRGNVRYILSDLNDFEFDGPYDLVMSSLALHHIASAEDKRSIYQRIYDALDPRGSFYNADIVIGSDDEMQELYMKRWRAFVSQSFPQQEVDRVVPHHHHEGDSPAKLVDHLRWLTEVGFRNVEIVWKNFNFAVYGGRKI